MKTLFLTLVLMLVAGSAQFAAAQDDEERTANKSWAIAVKVNKQKTVTPDRLKIQFVSLIEDSRCPTDTNCIWAGNARIKIKVSSGRGSEMFEINTNAGPTAATFRGYSINLVRLTPAPATNIRINRLGYTATFDVRKLSR